MEYISNVKYIQVIDPVEDYVTLMQSIFDFNQIKNLLGSDKLKVLRLMKFLDVNIM